MRQKFFLSFKKKKLLQTFICFMFILCISLNGNSQSTETFDNEAGGSTTFTENSQQFNISSETGENYNVFEHGYVDNGHSGFCFDCGWDGNSADQKFVDNSGSSNQNGTNNGSSVTIKTNGGTDLTVKSIYVFISTSSITTPSTTLTITGKKDGSSAFTITKSSGFANVTTFTPSNGFTYINFATEGASDYSNTNVDELVFTTTGNGDYIALDAFTWGAAAANIAPTATAPSAPIVNQDDTNIAIANNIQVSDSDGDNQTVSFTITGGTLTLGASGITFGGNGNGSSSFTASGTLSNINTALDAATFTPTPGLNGTNAGTIAFTTNDGTDTSSTASVTFNINDTIAPSFENSTPSSTSVTQTSFTLSTDINEAGTIYYVIVADGASAPSSAQVKAGQDSTGSTALSNGNASVSTGGFTNDFSITSLSASTAYDVYVVAEDNETSPNIQLSPTKIDVSTAAPIELTITGLTADNKTYDGTTDATATGTPALSGVIGLDDVSLTGTPTFTFASADVGTAIAVTTSGYSLTGTLADNYTLTQPMLSADITAIALTVTGLTANDKAYDGTTDTTASGTAALSGVLGTEDVTLSGTPVFTFASNGVAAGIVVATTGYTLSGTDAGNYTLTQPTLSANITPVELTITGLTADSKTYDGTTDATASGTAALSGVLGAEDVILSGTPVFTFTSNGVAAGIVVATNGYILSGTDAGNYTLTQPTLSADIIELTTVTSITRQNPTTNPTSADVLTWDVTFSSTVNNVDTTDFEINGTTATITSVTNPSGNSYYITISGGNLATLIGTATLNFAPSHDITDVLSNVLTNTTPTGTNENTYNLDSSLSTEEINTPNIKIYPNPASSMIRISIPVKEVYIYNISGKQVLNVFESSFSVEKLSEGLYLMNIITDKGSTIKKFIKN